MQKFQLLLWIIFSTTLFAQNDPSNFFQSYDPALNWVTPKADLRLTSQDFFQKTYQLFGLESPTDMQLARSRQDALGWTHHRFHQYHRGIRVEGGTYLLHEKDGKIIKANGHIFQQQKPNYTAQLAPNEAIAKALAAHPAKHYKWQNPVAEAHLRQFTSDPSASYFPQPKLVIVDRQYPLTSGQLTLAYTMQIYQVKPLAKYQVWVDAINGQIIQSYNTLHTTEGTAVTRYHGEQTISTTQREDGSYILRDDTRGEGVWTFNALNEFFATEQTDFVDEDNFWNNVNDAQDEVATDAHFGAERSYDFFHDHFTWNSFNNQGSPIISYVHVGQNFNNAFWDGTAMYYGDGNGEFFNPLTSIDVCAHEFTHGVTEYSAGLVYAFEPGALNESFSDIFGKTVEQLYVPEGFSWFLGERMMVNPEEAIRSMEDPNDKEHPKYYLGNYWYEEGGDNGGVHFNSGVQNFWYYLLCVGQEGVNEAGQAYQVPAIGMEKAMQIAFRNLSVYLTEDSNYPAARRGSLEAARDLYGYCSEEFSAVAEAWAAVGIGTQVQDNDLEIFLLEQEVIACTIEEFNIEFLLYNNSCNQDILSGTNLTVNYQFNEETPVQQVITLPQTLLPAQSVPLSFPNPILNPAIGEHEIKVWLEFADDPNLDNNQKILILNNRPYQNEDFAAVDAISIFDDACALGGSRPILASLRFLGCDTLNPSNLIPYQIAHRGSVYSGEESPFGPVAPFDIFFFAPLIQIDDFGFGNARFTVDYPGDSSADDNSADFFLANLNFAPLTWKETFSDFDLDSTRLSVQEFTLSQQQIQSFEEDEKLLMTGNSILDEENRLKVIPTEDPEDFFFANREFHTTLQLCPEVPGNLATILSFDLLQTHSDFDYEAYDINPNFSTMLTVMVNDSLIAEPIYGEDFNGSFQSYDFDLSPYQGLGIVNVKIIGLSLSSDYDVDNQSFTLNGDNNIIDNIEITFVSSTSDPEFEASFSIYPNPSQSSFFLERQFRSEQTQLAVFNIQGQLIENHIIATGQTQFEFGDHLRPGIYFIQLLENNKMTRYKLIKQ